MPDMKKDKVLEYLQDYNAIRHKDRDNPVGVYVLSNFTIQPVQQFLEVELFRGGVVSDVVVGGYDQVFQETMDSGSRLYASSPSTIIIALDFLKLIPECQNNLNNISLETIQERMNIIKSIIANVRLNTNALILINNFYLRKNSVLGILDTKAELGVKEMVLNMNLELIKSVKNEPNVFVVDAEMALGRLGNLSSFSPKLELLADQLLSNSALIELSREYGRYIKAMKGRTKKCLVLDLDNTLWGGVVGEDGLNGIKLGMTYPGNAFVDFQKGVLELYEKGFLLAINSKNNFDDAIEVFRKHPNCVLKEEHFSVLKINWKDKVTNLREIAAELNIGLDSFVFLDDNPSERALVKQELPEVLVPDMPEDVSLYRNTLESLFVFDLLKITEEDMKRNRMYAEQRDRKQLETSVDSIEDFLRKLELRVNISECDELSLARATQMTNKTNQFNLTTRRYDEEQMLGFFKSSNHKIYTLKAADKFGDHGITGLAIVKTGDIWEIDTFLMSCRIIGKSIEKALLQHIINEAKELGARSLVGEYIPTKKNIPASKLYHDNGFYCIEEKDGHSYWKIDLSESINLWPEWIDKKEF